MSKCKYIITLSDGSLFEVPSDNLNGEFEDFKKSLLNLMLTDISIKDVNDIMSQLISMNKSLILPDEIKGNIIGQKSINNLFGKDDSKRNLDHLKYVIKSAFKDYKMLNRESILLAAMPDDIKFQYLPENDILLINNNETIDQSNYVKGILEMLAYKYTKLKEINIDPVTLIKLKDNDLLAFLKIPSTNFTLNDLNSLYFDDSFLRDRNILSEITPPKEKWQDIKEKFDILAFGEDHSKSYSLEANYNIYELTPGDLIVTYNKNDNKKFFSLFIDYHINGEGDYVVTKLDGNSDYTSKATYKSLNIRAQKYNPASAFLPYNINTTLGYVEAMLPPNGEVVYSRNNFLNKNLKRGDKIITQTKTKRTEYEVWNIVGSNIIYDGNKVIPRSAVITGVMLNKAYHPELVRYSKEEILSSDSFTQEKIATAEDKKTIQKYDGVIFNGLVNNSVGIVVEHLDNIFLIYNIDTNSIEQVGSIDVKSHFVNDFLSNKLKETYEMDTFSENNPLDLVNLVEVFEKTDANYIKTKFNVVPYFRSLSIATGDYIVYNNKNYIITSNREHLIRVYDGENYIYLNKEKLSKENAYLVTNRIQNKKLADKSIIKNSFYISQDSKNFQNAFETEVFIDNSPDNFKGYLFFGKSDKDYEKYTNKNNYTNITNQYKTEKGFDLSLPIYKFTIGSTFVKDAENLIAIPSKNMVEDFSLIFDDLLPGAFIKFNNLKYWLLEKKVGDKWLISYSYLSNGSIRTVKKLIDSSAQIRKVYVPYYWKSKLAQFNSKISGSNNLLENEDKGIKTSKEINPLKGYDSPELIVAMTNILQDKFRIKINFIHNSQLDEFSDIKDINKLRAFVLNGEYYVNIDKANIAEPLHEVLHMVLASMKYSNFNEYMKLVESIQNHPSFNQIADSYNEVNSDVLEEVFVTLFSESVRKNILLQGVFTEEVFMDSVKKGIVEMFDLNNDLSDQSTYELLDTPIKDILINFSSKLLDGSEPLYNKDNAMVMMSVSTLLRELLDSGNLKQQCNG